MALERENMVILINQKPFVAENLQITRAINAHSYIFISGRFLDASENLKLLNDGVAIGVNEKYLETVKPKAADQTEKPQTVTKYRALYRGLVQKTKIIVKNGIPKLNIYGVSYTYQWDQALQTRSFQNAAMTYKQLLEQVTGKKIEFTKENPDQKIGRLIVQHQETVWQFCKRMASRYRDPLVVIDTLAAPGFILGIEKGAKPVGTLEGKVYTVTRDSTAYYEYLNAGSHYDSQYNPGKEKITEGDYCCYHLRDDKCQYDIGDQLTLAGDALYVSRSVIKTVKGIIRYDYDLMSEKGLKQKKILNEHLAGASFCGEVIEVVKDQVKVKFDFDSEQKKETACLFKFATCYSAEGNTGWYCMPEIGEKIRICFPVANEEKAFATGMIHQSGENRSYQTRFLRTKHGQLMQFDNHGIQFETTHGKNEKTGAHLKIRVSDVGGVSIESEKAIQLATPGALSLVADQKVLMTAGREIRLKCKTSGLKINQNILRSGIDIYERNKGKFTGDPEPNEDVKPRGGGGGSKPVKPLTPTPAPVPADDNKKKDDEQKKYYLGTDGQKHYLDSTQLYQCELNAYNNSAFNKSSDGTTYCNRFAEAVLQQYTGSKELMSEYGAAKLCVDIYAHISKSTKWKSCNAVEAGTKAKEGYFVIAITTKTMNSKLSNHIAVICPKGDSIARRGINCPSIAQQGSIKIIYGKDDGYTANFGWDRDSLGKIRYYYKIPDSGIK